MYSKLEITLLWP